MAVRAAGRRGGWGPAVRGELMTVVRAAGRRGAGEPPSEAGLGRECEPEAVAGLGTRRPRRAYDGRASRRTSRGWGPAVRGELMTVVRAAGRRGAGDPPSEASL